MTQINIKFTRGVPPTESFPTEKIAECTCAVLNEYGNVIQQYAPSLGFQPLRQLIASENNTIMEQVLVGQGSLQLLDLASRLLIRPGDLVYVESPTYDRTITTLRRAGANVIGFKLTEDGPDTAEMTRRLKNGERPKFMYMIPDFQNPSGTVMSPEKRQILVNLAEEYDFWIIEDTPYRILRYRGEPIPTLYQRNPNRVLSMSSYSKTICPGLRVGYMIIPQELIKPMAKMAEDTYINASYINQAIVYDFVRRGYFAENLIGLKQLYRERVDAMLASLANHMSDIATWTKPEGGFFIGLYLHKNDSILKLMEKAAQTGLELTDGRGFFADQRGENFVRLPFCGITPQEIEAGVALLSQAARSL